MIVLDVDMQEPQDVPVPGGRAVVLSRRAPGKDGPNEDGAAVLVDAGDTVLLAVADGMGGGPSGEAASRMVIEALQTRIGNPARDPEVRLRSLILDAVEEANRAILETVPGAATTLAAVEIVDGTVRPYHAGDSGILVTGQRGRLKVQSVSHSPVGYGVEAGLIAPGDALKHRERHLVSNIVGTADLRIEIGSPTSLAARDTLVVASDGVMDCVTAAELSALVRTGPLPEAAARLAERCRSRMVAGGSASPDDLTVILYRRERTRTSA